jgi:hypothetical protein
LVLVQDGIEWPVFTQLRCTGRSKKVVRIEEILWRFSMFHNGLIVLLASVELIKGHTAAVLFGTAAGG